MTSNLLEDIRDKPHLVHQDVLQLNFIRDPGIYLYRRHYRAGLRSHIMQVLESEAVENETQGKIIDGVKWYPRAKPVKMLRIFRTRFNSLRDAEEELKRVKIIEAYLTPDYFARSEEFLVEYRRNGEYEMLLCGLQEYVEGETLEPWSTLDDNYLSSLSRQVSSGNLAITADQWLHLVRKKAEDFLSKLKQMILKAHHVPDLAGAGNLILTRSAGIKLVDINNISRVSFGSTIDLDDRGYPVCDKSIEALSLLEQKLLGRFIAADDPIYSTYLDPQRMREVKALAERFHRTC
jgi:hypothetical protein